MQSLIVALLLLIPLTVFGQTNTMPQWPQLQFANPSLGWVVNDRKIVGHDSRVELYRGQDPFPFCAAVAASILYDQHQCMTERRDCRLQPRSSALSIVPASQHRTDSVVWDKGGFTNLALRHIAKSGAASHQDCNTDSINNPRMDKSKEFHNLFVNYSQYSSIKDYGGYLSRHYRDEFILDLKFTGLYRDGVTDLLDNRYNDTNSLLTDIILHNGCKTATVVGSRPYKVTEITLKEFNIERAHNLIKTQLKQNVPVAISLCLNALVGLEKCSKHALVIYTEGFARNSITGDVRKVYRVANTWGESWQETHNDGWVFADQLLLGIYEIFWLE